MRKCRKLVKSFKPYKGVSSNLASFFNIESKRCFKPYKGVSSNLSQNLFSSKDRVSNPIREYLQILIGLAIGSYTGACFKPYKGVSSNCIEMY